MNFRPMQKSVVCYVCNKFGHVAKFCRSKNMSNNGLVNKNQSDEKGKENVDEIKDQHKKMWVKKEDPNVVNVSTLDFGAGTSSDN